MNQKEENVFEGPKKKPVNAARKERKKGLQVRYTRLPELDRLSKGFYPPSPPDAMNSQPFKAFQTGNLKFKRTVDILDLKSERKTKKAMVFRFLA